MSKFNTRTAFPVGRGPIATETQPSGATFQGAPGFARDEKSELFLLSVSNMVGESTFYENATDRDDRFTGLVRAVAAADPDWLIRFAGWLRGTANMRSASLVLAAEGTKALLESKQLGSRKLIGSVLQRADEPGEFLAYWRTHFGSKLPMPVKRGVADSVSRLYTERNIIKYNVAGKAVRFGTVVHATHPNLTPVLRYLLSLSKVSDVDIPDELGLLRANAEFVKSTPEQIKGWAQNGSLAEHLRTAGMTWEAVPSLVNGPWTRELWESIIPSMGYMALLRNLRNLDQAEVSDVVAATVAARLADPEQVAKSRQFPFRFYAAHKNVGSLRWGHALETGLRHSLSNVPALTGRTLVLVDQSPSMFPGPYYAGDASKSDIVFAEKAALFGSALALRCDHADLYGYGFRSYPVQFRKGDAVLKTMEKFHVDDGTDTFGALQRHYANHDRVVIVTDEQTAVNRQMADPYLRRQYGLDKLGPFGALVPAHVPVFTWNLCGYQYGHATGPNWHTSGGLTDQAFSMIPLIEQGRDADWPF
ncbi:TROVE domain-containing protein [Nocardia sp. NBC_00565]|uniref:TROVE domain-containing protein n=1 Tax=Nocardia sp. NBC_00565 TaxID=2975993 RepID=UPI002E821D45|nr:TROVE domain-containing protein [Nocardia sp. NBC_00565]WUC03719.1 TROVE domain-containing protein [Nocardia sp. NBC_00565]